MTQLETAPYYRRENGKNRKKKHPPSLEPPQLGFLRNFLGLLRVRACAWRSPSPSHAAVKTASVSLCVCPRGRKTAGNAGPSSTKTGGAPASVSDSSDTQSKFNAGGGLSPAGSAPCVCVVSWAVVEWKKATRRSSIVKRTGWWARLLRPLVLLHKLLLLHLCVLCVLLHLHVASWVHHPTRHTTTR